MKKFFAILFTIAALVVFSSVSRAQDSQTAPAHRYAVKRGVVEAPPKRKVRAVQKKVATAPKPMIKKSVTHVAPKARAVAKKRIRWSAFWKFASNPFIVPVWVALFITGLAILDRIFWKRREPEEYREVIEENAEEYSPSWSQRLRDWIKDFFRRLKKKPAMAAG